jgi:hypothetical protein
MPDHSLTLAPSVTVSRTPRIGWLAAAAIGLGVSAVLALLLLYIPHWMLTKIPSLSRGIRVAMATGWIGAATVLLLALGVRFGHAPARRD